VILISDEVCTEKDFANFGPCHGLTPGYWGKWRNQYTESQFLLLLEGSPVPAGQTERETLAMLEQFMERSRTLHVPDADLYVRATGQSRVSYLQPNMGLDIALKLL
jgi:hypothetical protein